MYQPSPALYNQHNSNYHPKYSAATPPLADTLPSLSPTYVSNTILNSRGELRNLVCNNNSEADPNIDQLSPDEKVLLQQAEQEEKQYHREIKMTTLINSR